MSDHKVYVNIPEKLWEIAAEDARKSRRSMAQQVIYMMEIASGAEPGTYGTMPIASIQKEYEQQK
uniref:Uncharacterized protein n=1 Tax=viral metagenome TaxID=1070528 RepID=A0A6M3LUJ1_9ZZZZ